MKAARAARARRWLAPEVVQTSSMDCGPAALKCLLEGHGIAVSYGRLREACQTDVDGTAIDTIEVVANQLGLEALQIMIPLDHVFLADAGAQPAMVVVRHADGATHFVVAWRRHGRWLQVMDPSTGRHWTTVERFGEEVFRHEAMVPAADWRAFAGSEDFLAPLRVRMARLGMSAAAARVLVGEALADAGWRSLATLDASVRLADSLRRAGGVDGGGEAGALAAALFRRARDAGAGASDLIPDAYWSARACEEAADAGRQELLLSGAVLMRVKGRRGAPAAGADELPPLSPELAAALTEKGDDPLQAVWRLLREDGALAPLVLVGAMGIAAGALVLEALLFRGIFDIGAMLGGGAQRIGAALALLAFMLVMLAIQFPIILETMRHGRHLDTRLRIALLAKLPLLHDRYFQSRPVSDMADRSHGIHATRTVPAMGLGFVQALFELVLTFAGIVLVAPASTWHAAALLLTAMVLPLLAQPLLNERDLRVRNHAGALSGFYLDALLGLVPVRAHRGERNLTRAHESLLVEWTRACRGWIRISLTAEGVQSLVCLALAGWLLVDHFSRAGSVSGGDLLLVFWTLKLPAAGSQLSSLAHQYPAQRNVLMRLLEPLSAPVETIVAAPAQSSSGGAFAAAPGAAAAGAGVRIAIEDVSVLAGGHQVLEDVNLAIAPGEHVAVVGVSGAGKSSLLGLLLGWHRPCAGRVRVDGTVLDGRNVEGLRRVTAWVDPGIQIWNRSFLDNLAYAAGDDGLARAGATIGAAGLRGVVEKLPQGLQTVLGEGGAMLSGGEGQRVRLGRALMMAAPRLALLDEPFRGMDRAQRHRLLAEARQWWRGATLLCVTHDVGDTRAFDRVLVVEDGRIVEDGAPARLAAGPSRYRELLEAEESLREAMWGGDHWRRIAMQGGRVVEASKVAA
jgi:ATP-binding cassette subfamily B protein